MTFRILSGLESGLPEVADADIKVSDLGCLELCRDLASGYHVLKQGEAEGRSLQAYLLLDAWDDCPLAAALSETWPQAAAARVAIPDEFYAGREDEAPCLVPLPSCVLPDGCTDTLAEVRAREFLAGWLEEAGKSIRQRLVRQHLCAVLFSTDSASSVARHLAGLGYQYEPGSRTARLFRYQDPRVMQRVWPMLPSAQQVLWMGPVQAWWSLRQSWGPWDGRELFSGEVEISSAAPAWFKAEKPIVPQAQPETPAWLNRLMTADQWRVAHWAQVGNRIWLRFAENDIPRQAQPDGNLMLQLLEAGASLGLDEHNLEDYVWCSVRYREAPPSIDWHAPSWARVLAQSLQALRSDPDTRFVSAFHACLNAGEETHDL